MSSSPPVSLSQADDSVPGVSSAASNGDSHAAAGAAQPTRRERHERMQEEARELESALEKVREMKKSHIALISQLESSAPLGGAQ